MSLRGCYCAFSCLSVWVRPRRKLQKLEVCGAAAIRPWTAPSELSQAVHRKDSAVAGRSRRPGRNKAFMRCATKSALAAWPASAAHAAFVPRSVGWLTATVH